MEEENKKEISNGIGIAAEKALDFLEKVIGGPIIEGTGILTDKIQYIRFKNKVDRTIKAIEFLKLRGVKTPKKIPIKDLTTLLDYSSYEDDEIMQDCWSKLLANTLNPENTFDISHIFSQVLNQLSISEILVLNFMLINSFQKSSEDRPYFEKRDLIRKLESEFQTGLLIIDNLLRLRLIEEEPPRLVERIQENSDNFDDKAIITELVSSDSYRLSNFGVQLMKQIKD
ncbi:Abi-alpha family protein [Tenacibaculum ovolyticum]|uniref:Abi-alpha family protein n=1 Tax=Tenacibaculum ovolyticum TaxID=104270 RepID=UPI001F3FE389|nr:Abi-alpha family protein [Tenacibaculum ovolyticum]